MSKALALEFQKIRRRRVWAIVAAMIGVQLLWSLWGVQRMDAEDLQQGWLFLLFQFPLLNSIMMPVIAAVVASRLCDIEHKGETLKLLHTVMPAGRLFTAKFLCGGVYILAAVLFQLVVMVGVGLGVGFAGDPPLAKLFYYLLFTMGVTLTILLLQQVLSLLIKNQMVPLTVGIMGSFAGLFLLYFPPGLARFLLWGYYGVLMIVGMDWDREARLTSYYYTSPDWVGFTMLVILFSVIYLTGLMLFKRKEM